MAIIAVIGVHVANILIPTLSNGLFVGGAAGVDVFFVLSGFLISSLLLEEFDRSRSIGLRSFYRRRILRLWPALYVLLIGDFVYSMVVHVSAGWTLRGDGLIAVYQSNWAWALGWPVPVGLDQTWSLAVEEQFYLLWPILLLGLLRWRQHLVPWVIVAIGIGSALWRAHVYATTHYWVSALVETPGHLDGLMLGSLLAWGLHRGWVVPRRALAYATLPAAGTLIWIIQTGALQLGFYFGVMPLADVCAAVLLLAALDSGTLAYSALATPALRWIGRISYSLYLWHPLVFLAAYDTWPNSDPWLRLFGAMAISLAVAVISHYAVERPFLRLKDGVSLVPRFRRRPILVMEPATEALE